MNQSQPIWVPSEDRIKNSNFSKYYDFLKEGYNLSFSNYHELHNWSITDIENFGSLSGSLVELFILSPMIKF